ncbi:MAG: cobalamin biosynthesis protein [Chloroflexi bacterium]|nr:cobalamin biosynthesis protein [Chloroflexota bacterium]
MPTRLIIAGGFLGAGKTTLLLRAARLLTEQGYRVGLVTNDQGEDLVDTATANQAEIPVTEVAGGCFCCRFPDLLKALQRLAEVAQPDIVLAEPVGSCTDLVATILRPLAQFHPDQFQVAPLTILHDASRNIASFPPNVHYLYEQQLSEAELIVLTKTDLLSESAEAETAAALATRYPQARILSISARTGQGLTEWLAVMLGQASRNPAALMIDYARYAEAEAVLGWLNAKGIVRADRPFSATAWMEQLFQTLGQTLSDQHAPIAHVKLLITTPTSALKASVTQSGSAPTWDLGPDDTQTDQLEFTLNARVNIEPPTLEQAVVQTIERIKPQPDSRYYFTHFECFSPLPPEPTHRLQ